MAKISLKITNKRFAAKFKASTELRSNSNSITQYKIKLKQRSNSKIIYEFFNSNIEKSMEIKTFQIRKVENSQDSN